MSELLTTTVTLPSGTEAEIREFSGRDENIMSNEKFMRAGRVIDMVLTNVIRRYGDKENLSEAFVLDMLSADRAAALVEARRLTYGDQVKGEAPCPHCNEPIEIDVNLDELELIPAPPALDTVVTVGDTTVTLRALMGKDERRIFQARNKPDLATVALLTRIENASDLKTAELRGWLNNLSSRYRQQLREAARSLEFGYQLSLEQECYSCGREVTIELMQVKDFLFPVMDSQ